jgi:hypothetical protein
MKMSKVLPCTCAHAEREPSKADKKKAREEE